MEKQDLIPTIITNILELEKFSDKLVLVQGDYIHIRELSKETKECIDAIKGSEPQLAENYFSFYYRSIRSLESIKLKDFSVRKLEDLRNLNK